MAGPIAVLDADVLVPILSCDLLLTAFNHDLYQPLVTPKILDDVERRMLRSFAQLDPDALRRRVEQMRQALALHTHDDTDDDEAAFEGVNRKDRHVVSAALAHDADIIVTNDRRLRRETDALGHPLRTASGDGFALSLLADTPDAIDQVLDDLVAKRVRRPMTRDQLLDQLAGAFPSFVTALDPSR